MSQRHRLLSAAVAAVTLLTGLAPAAHAADPDGTVTLASGSSTVYERLRLLAQSDQGSVLQHTNDKGQPTGGVLLPTGGGAPTALPWLRDTAQVLAVGSVAVSSECTPECAWAWHVLPDGPSGRVDLPAGGALVTATPDGWVQQEAGTDGSVHLVRVVAATGERTDLGSPLAGATTFQGAADTAGMAVSADGTSIWQMSWDAPGQFHQVPLAVNDTKARIWQVRGQAVLFSTLVTGWTYINRVDSSADASVAPLRTMVGSSGVASAVMNDAEVMWRSSSGIVYQAIGQSAIHGMSVVNGFLDLAIEPGTGRLLFTPYPSLVRGTPYTLRSMAVPDATTMTTLYSTGIKDMEASQVLLAPGRVVWRDDSAATAPVSARTLSDDASPLALGSVTPVAADAKTHYGVAVAGRRTVVNAGGTLEVHLADRPDLPAQGLATANVLAYRPPQASGTRVVSDSRVYNLVTGYSTGMPAGVVRTALWGDRLAWTNGVGDISVQDLVSGATSVVVPVPDPKPAGWKYPQLGLWGTTLAWHDGVLHTMDLTTKAVTDLPTPDPVAVDLAVGGSYLGYVGQVGPTGRAMAHLYPLGQGGQPTDLGPVRYSPTGQMTVLSLQGSQAGWVDGATGLPKVSPLPHVAEAPRYLGNPFAPTTFVTGNGPWQGEWVFTKALPTCTVTIRDGSTVVRSLDCATANGSALATWDGTDTGGHPVRSGSYTWTVTASDADGAALAQDGTTAPITGSIAVHAITRLAGTDRFATSAAVSRATYAAGTPVAYVANGLAFPDALSAAPAAGHQGGPVLLTQAGSLPSVVAAELARLQPKRIVVLGSAAAVSDAVSTTLKSYTTGTVTRLAGADRFATSAAVSKATYATGTPVAYVANGMAFPDALSGAPAGAHLGGPVLLTQAGVLPGAIATELARLKPKRIVVLGSSAAVSDAVATRLKGYTAGTVTRLAGADRFATSAAVSKASYAAGVPVAYLANGMAFPDALSGAPAAGTQAGPVLLVNGTNIPSAIATELARLKPQHIVVLGSSAAVSDAVAAQLPTFTQ